MDHSDSLNRVWGRSMEVGNEMVRMYVLCTSTPRYSAWAWIQSILPVHMYTNLHLHTLGLLQFNIANSTCLMTSRSPDWNASTNSPFPNLARPRLISLRTLLLYAPSLNQGTTYRGNTWHSQESGPTHIPKTPMRDMHDNSHSHSYGTTRMAAYWSHQSKIEKVDTNGTP